MNDEQSSKINLQSETEGAINMPEEKIFVDQVFQTSEQQNSPADFYEIAPVRTYKGDINDTVKGDKITTAKVLIAEQKRTEQEKSKTDVYSIENNTNKFKLGISVILIGLAIVAIIYVTLNFLIPASDIVQKPIIEESNLFVVDSTEFLDITEKLNSDLKNDILKFVNGSFSENSINEIILHKTVSENSGQVIKKIPITSVLEVLNIKPPEVFKRSLSNDFMIGVYKTNSQNNRFLLFKLSDFANAYDSIFDYEIDIVSNLRWFFGGFNEFDKLTELKKKKIEILPQENIFSFSSTSVRTSGTSTFATSTKGIKDLENIETEIKAMEKIIFGYRNFIDMVLQNTDSRTVVDKEGKIVFYYTFIDRQWIIFAGNIEVLKEVKRRIREKNLVQ